MRLKGAVTISRKFIVGIILIILLYAKLSANGNIQIIILYKSGAPGIPCSGD